MDPFTALLGLATLLFIGAFIARPLLNRQREAPGSRVRSHSASVLRERADLLAERNRIYTAIRALDFDHETGKVTDEDYAAQRYQLVAEGVDVLQQLDALPDVEEERADDALEAMINARRSGSAKLPASPRTNTAEPAAVAADGSQQAAFCPQCGTRAKPGDRFCGACGARL